MSNMTNIKVKNVHKIDNVKPNIDFFMRSNNRVLLKFPWVCSYTFVDNFRAWTRGPLALDRFYNIYIGFMHDIIYMALP